MTGCYHGHHEATQHSRNALGFQKYFIAFIAVKSQYTYVKPLTLLSDTPNIIKAFVDKIQESYGRTPGWLISDNTGDYISKVVKQMLEYMDINHVPNVPHNFEEKGLAEG